MSTPNGDRPQTPDSSGSAKPRSQGDPNAAPPPQLPPIDRTLAEDFDARTMLEAQEDGDSPAAAPTPSQDTLASTLPEGFFDKTISESALLASKADRAKPPAAPPTPHDQTLVENADQQPRAADDSDRTMTDDGFDKTISEDPSADSSPGRDVDQTLAEDSFEKTLVVDEDDVTEQFATVAESDAPAPSDSPMTTMPEASSDSGAADFDPDKTSAVGGLSAPADDDGFGKTMVMQEEGAAEESFGGATMADSAAASGSGSAVADDPYGRTMQDDGIGQTLLGDEEGSAANDEFEGRTMLVDAGGQIEEDRTFVMPEGGSSEPVGQTVDFSGKPAGRSDVPMENRTQWEGSKTSGIPQGSGTMFKASTATPAQLDVAVRAVTGLQFGAITAADYSLEKQLGEGGMGVVYVAKQRSLGREVVFKTLKPLPSAQVDKLKTDGRYKSVVSHRTQMFLSEAVVTADLFHPNIVPIYEMAEAPDGSLFYTMKWVRGVGWNKHLQEMSLDENIDALMKVSDAIAFAHSRHVLNRDLKPENVMLGEYGEVIVLDWGLALPFGEGATRLPVSTTAGLGSGTPAYMPPELITGPLNKIGPGADIYLLGAMLFEVITGEAPHEFKMTGTQSATQKMAEVRRVVIENDIRPTEHKGELMDIALKAMATKPQERYASVVEFQQAIRDYQRHAASRTLVDRAREMTTVVKPTDAAAAAAHEEQVHGYTSYQNALALYNESLREWPGNTDAREGLSETQLNFAELALTKGDFDLGLSVLDTNAETHTDTRTRLLQAREERESRVRRMKVLKIAAGAMALGLLVFLAVAARLQFNLTAAVAEAAQADKRAKEADEAFQAANVAKLAADQAKVQAEKDKAEAEQNKLLAEQKLTEANAEIKVAEKKIEEADGKLKIAGDQLKVAGAQLKDADVKLKDAQEKQLVAAKNLEKAQGDLLVAQERVADASYRAGLADADRHVREGRYPDARRKLEDLKSRFAERCKVEWQLLWDTVRAGQAVSLTKPIESLGVSSDGRILAAADNAGVINLWPINAQGLIDEARVRKLLSGSRVRCVVIAPDNKTLAATGDAGTIQIWSLDAAAPPKELNGHAGPVNTLRFSADGQRLVSGGNDRTVRLWDIAGGSELAQVKTLYSAQCVDISRDGKVIVAGTASLDEANGVGYAWNVATQNDMTSLHELRRFQVPPEGKVKQNRGLVAVALTPDGRFAVSNGPSAEIFVWQVDLRDQRAAKTTKVDTASVRVGNHSPRVERVRALSFNADGSLLLASGDDGTISVWNRDDASGPLPTFKRSQILYGHSGPVRGCLTLPQSTELLVSGSYDQHMFVWNLKTYPASREWLDKPADAAETTASVDHNAILGEPESAGSGMQRMPRLTQPARSIATTTRLAVLTEPPQWEFQSPRLRVPIVPVSERQSAKVAEPPSVLIVTGHTDSVLSAVFNRAGNRVLTASRDQTARVWNSATGRPASNAAQRSPMFQDLDNVFAEGHQYDVFALQFFPQGDRLLTSSFDGTMRIWDARIAPNNPAGRELATLPETGMYGVVDLSRDGQWILTAGRGNSAQLWNTDKVLASKWPRPDRVLDGQHRFRVTTVAVSPDNHLLVTADREGALLVWGAESGKVLGRLRTAHAGEVTKAVFLKDGSQLLTSGVDRQVRLWNVVTTATGVSLVRQQQFAHDGMVVGMALSPRGDRFLTVTRKGLKKSATITAEALSSLTRVTNWSLSDGSQRQLDISLAEESEMPLDKLADLARRGTFSIAWASNGITAVVTSPDGVVRFVNTDTGRVISSLTIADAAGAGSPARPFAAVVPPHEAEPQHLVTQTSNVAYLWRLKDGENLVSFRPQGPVFSAGYAFDGKVVATSGRSIRIFNADESSANFGRLLHKIEYPHYGVTTSVEFSPARDSRQFLSTGYDGVARIWEWLPEQQSVRMVHELKEHDGPVRFGTWSADGSRLLTVGHDAAPRAWKLTPDAAPQSLTLRLDSGIDPGAAPAKDGNEPARDFDQLCGAFSWDGRFVAVGGRDAATQESVGWIWDLQTLTEKGPALHAVVRGHGLGGVNSVSFLPNDDRLLTGGNDGTARLWDWHQNRPVKPNEPAHEADFLISLIRPGEGTTHRGAVTSVRVTREGTIVTASSDGTVILWPTTPAAREQKL